MAAEDPDLPRDPVIEAFKAGVDRTLIEAQRRRSIDERIQTMVAALELAEALHQARRQQRSS
jgi:hypothetical protein